MYELELNWDFNGRNVETQPRYHKLILDLRVFFIRFVWKRMKELW